MYDADKPMLVGLILLISTLLGLVATGVLAGGSFFPHEPKGLYLPKIAVNGTPVRVELANTPEARVNGLSGRESLPREQGMLFVFEESEKYPIWMRNMNFPLDVLWIDANGTIVDIWKDAHPSSYPFIYEPHERARFILEVNAGFVEIYNVEIGDSVTGLRGLSR